MKCKPNPIKYSKHGKKVAMEIGNIVIISKKKSNRLRNIACSVFDIKSLVFGPRGERKKSKK